MLGGAAQATAQPTTTTPAIDTAIATAVVTEICSPRWVAENASGLGGQY